MLNLDRIIWRFTAIALAGALSGCDTLGFPDRVWYKPGGTMEERDRILAAAQVQAAQAVAAYPPGSPTATVDRKQTEQHTVLTFMTAAGWQLVPKSEAAPLGHAKKTKSAPRSTAAPTALDH